MSAPIEKILFVERIGASDKAFAPALEQKGFRVEVVQSGRKAVDCAAHETPLVIVLNAASLITSGMRIYNRIRESIPIIPIIHILPEATPSEVVRRCTADAVLVMPFTARKLINQIKRLAPAPHHDILEVGGIRFAPSVRLVQAHGREKRLTPRAAALLELFLRHPGKTLERSYLMRNVWDTNYVGDTRTLDVHVRWVREAIEVEPAAPAYIVTVRGIGYRFDPAPLPGRDGRKSP